MKISISTISGFLLLSSILIISGCTQRANHESEQMMNSVPSITRAIAVLHPTEGNMVSGVVTFTKENAGIRVVANIKGLSEGKHGFHIHQYGDCSASDGTSAGGHFNPENVEHGGPDSEVRHVGDLGNIEIDADSTGNYDRIDTVITFNGSHSIIGRAVVIHAGEDDLTSQPTGNAGARVACGVIGITSEQSGNQ